MSEIAVLVPMLGRPHQAAAVMDSLFRAATVETQIVFIVSPGDDEVIVATEAIRRAFTDGSVDVLQVNWEPGRGDYAKKINAGLWATDAPFVFTGASDIRFTTGWDRRALEGMRQADKVGVVGTDDHCNPRTRNARRASTHSLVRRAYIDDVGGTADGGPGVLLHEGYWHNFVDDELVQTATARGAYRPSRAVVTHLHPMSRKAEVDDTYRRGVERFDEDRQLFMHRTQLWRRQRRTSRAR